MTAKKCQECHITYDFENHQSASCSTCKKNYLCPSCYYTHKCIKGKSRNITVITNPKWIVNLVNSLDDE